MRKNFVLVSLALVGVVAGCASVPDAPKADAQLAPTAGNTARGVVSFTQVGDRVLVSAEIAGLGAGPHGFHVHDKGDCSAADGTSAGGHFNPGGKAHGSPDLAEHHAGDLPQLIAGADGTARASYYSDSLSIGGPTGNVLGRSVVVHASADDFKTQPAGNSGSRIACGVIVAR
jgi:Cu-Zn family superoxide dismutase